MNFSLLNNEFCNAKFLTMFLIFMRLILSIEEVEKIKKFQTYNPSLSLAHKNNSPNSKFYPFALFS